MDVDRELEEWFGFVSPAPGRKGTSEITLKRVTNLGNAHLHLQIEAYVSGLQVIGSGSTWSKAHADFLANALKVFARLKAEGEAGEEECRRSVATAKEMLSRAEDRLRACRAEAPR